MSNPIVTIVVVPRERFSHSERSLANIYENTSCAFKLTYVSAGAPARIQRHLERESEERGFHLIRVPVKQLNGLSDEEVEELLADSDRSGRERKIE